MDGDYIPQHEAEIEWGEWGKWRPCHDNFQHQRLGNVDLWRYPVEQL